MQTRVPPKSSDRDCYSSGSDSNQLDREHIILNVAFVLGLSKRECGFYKMLTHHLLVSSLFFFLLLL